MCAIYSFEVAAWFNTFGGIRMNVKFTHPNSRINSRKIHRFTRMCHSHEFRTNSYEFRTNSPSFALFRFLTALKLSSHSLLTMSQQTMSHLASLASRPDPAADTLAHYQALPVAHHQLEEAAYLSGALGVDDVLWAGLHPSTPPPRSSTSTCAAPPATPTSGGGVGPQRCEGNCAANSPPLNF